MKNYIKKFVEIHPHMIGVCVYWIWKTSEWKWKKKNEIYTSIILLKFVWSACTEKERKKERASEWATETERERDGGDIDKDQLFDIHTHIFLCSAHTSTWTSLKYIFWPSFFPIAIEFFNDMKEKKHHGENWNKNRKKRNKIIIEWECVCVCVYE